MTNFYIYSLLCIIQFIYNSYRISHISGFRVANTTIYVDPYYGRKGEAADVYTYREKLFALNEDLPIGQFQITIVSYKFVRRKNLLGCKTECFMSSKNG